MKTLVLVLLALMAAPCGFPVAASQAAEADSVKPRQRNEVRSLASPDGRIELRVFEPVSQRQNPPPDFEVRFNGKLLLNGELGLCSDGRNLLEKASVKSSQRRSDDSTYTVPWGKNNPIRDHFNELTLNLENNSGPLRRFQVVFRAYDDGVAYRYVIPEQPGADSIEITDEPGGFQFVGDPRMWPLYRENYTTSHEGIYENARFSTLTNNSLIDVPLLAEFDDGVSVSLTQASLRNYAGLYFRTEGEGKERWLRCDLPPLPDQPDIKVRSRLPLSSPWRVCLMGTSPGRLIESNLILNLNDPNAIGDTSWLKPGKTTFYWWSGVQEPTNVQAAVRWEEDYIDYCARNDIPYHAVIGTEGDHPWYFQTQRHYSPPGPDADVTRVRDGFPIEQIVQYAHARGVRIRVWVHWKPLSQHLEEAFTQYEQWGLSGLMVDFLDRNDQEMVLFAEEVLKSAARHHLNIQFHGVWAPTGLERTYPNLFNHEGVLNLEYLKGTDRCTPEHDVTVPFTRMVAGPMDYHLGGFRSVKRSEFKNQWFKPIVLGTRCLALAMYVVYDNPMPMVCDMPDVYEGSPGFDFLREVPTVWDETHVLAGEVGDYIVMARRHGADWYLGAMTDWTPRNLKVPLDFLPQGTWQAKIWADATDVDDPNQLIQETRTVSPEDNLDLRLASGGGQVIRFHPMKESP